MPDDIQRKIVFWDCDDDAEILHHETEYEAIEAHLDGIYPAEWGETITVYGFARKITPKIDPDRVLEYIEEHEWEEFIREDGMDITPRMKEAAQTFVDILHEEFVPWRCDRVSSEEIDVAAWVKEHCPHWLIGKSNEEKP